MYTKNRKVLVLSLIAMVLTAVTATTRIVAPAFSAPTTQLLIIPNSIVNASLAPGSTIIVNASVTDVADLTTWQVKIFYDPSILNCTNAWYPTDHVFAGKGTVPVTPMIDNTIGYVSHGNTLSVGQTSFTGNGTLCQVEFQVLSRGNCSLQFSTPYGGSTFLWDSTDSLISATVKDGYFDNREAVPITYTLTITSTAGGTTNPLPGPHQYAQGTVVQVTATPDATHIFDHWELDGSNVGSANPISVTMNSDHTLNAVFTLLPAEGTKIYVDPPEIIDPTLGPSSSFSINITINHVANMHICQFNLTYDPNIISWMGIELFRIQNQPPSPKVISDDLAGYLWIKLTYANPVTIVTQTGLARITFHVNAYGATYLNLTDTQLTDFAGQPITHTAVRGFFATLIQDLAVTNVVPSRNWVYQGWLVYINVTARNLGNMNESFDVNATYDSSVIGTQHVTDLPPGVETTLTFTWGTSSVTPCHNYTINGECVVLPFEQNTTNNVCTDGNVKVRFMGDIDGNGSVDMIDIRRVAKAFASYPGHPRWDPDADLDQSVFIDMKDIRLAAVNFGKGCTP
jgi:hypothetical protein